MPEILQQKEVFVPYQYVSHIQTMCLLGYEQYDLLHQRKPVHGLR